MNDEAVTQIGSRPLAVKAFGITHQGRVRRSNEDQFLIAELTKDPFNKKVIDSQMAFVKRVGAFEQLYEADSVRAYKHFFTS